MAQEKLKPTSEVLSKQKTKFPLWRYEKFIK